MKKTIKIVAVAGLIAFLLSLSIYSKVESVVYVEKIVEVEKEDPLSYQQRAWLGALIWCESHGNPNAINKIDRDGTASYGILQFKPSTFQYYADRYGIEVPVPIKTENSFMNPKVQIQIVEQMILRGDVKWSQQFPSCTQKLGKPPVKLST